MAKEKPKIDPHVKVHFEALAEKWKSTIIAREQVPVFTGGAISKGRMANLDCLGEGPERIRLGRKVVYPVGPFVKWLIDRAEIIESREDKL
jgi:hypothetical protein